MHRHWRRRSLLENRNQVLATRTDDMVEALTAFRE
jgi:hypothetical protein